MIPRRPILIMLALLALAGVVAISAAMSTPPPAPASDARATVEIVSQDPNSVVLELTIPGYELSTIERDGVTYQQISINGMAQTAVAGAPQLPIHGTWLGVPAAADLHVELLEGDFDTFTGHPFAPAPQLVPKRDAANMMPAGVSETFVRDEAAYAANILQPTEPVTLGEAGYLRDQAVAQVQFFPVQSNPATGDWRIYHRLRAKISWPEQPTVNSTAAATIRSSTPAYEQMLAQQLINYDSLQRPSATTPTTFNTTTPNAVDASPPALKISVQEDGLYRLTYADLTNAGFDLSGVDPRNLQLFNQGSEQAILVNGEGDGAFDAGDTILFYGTAVNTLYTNTNVYWLHVGSSSGKRMTSSDGTPGSATPATDFPATFRAEEDDSYFGDLTNNAIVDRWLWGDVLSPSTAEVDSERTHTFTLNNISTTAVDATVRVQLQGITTGAHRTRLLLNGTPIDDQTWSGQIPYTQEVTVSHALLQEGTNTLTVKTVDTGAPVDQLSLNWFEIEYHDTTVAENDALHVNAPGAGTYRFTITDFSSNDIQVFDVTDPANIVQFSNVVTGSNQVALETAVTADTTLLALTPTAYRTPHALTLDDASNWRTPSPQADYLIITPEAFLSEAQTLAAHRQSGGLSTAVVTVTDIYDEFNHGLADNQAIRDFLSYAYYNWQAPAPTYVLLLGNGNLDYKNNLALGWSNHVPTHLVPTDSLGETASDNWFVQISGSDVLPDMFIGRLPANSAAEAAVMVDKVIAYEQNPPTSPWNTNALFVADDGDPSFETTQEQLIDRLPYYYTAERLYDADYSGNMASAIVNEISSGTIMVNYVGHGNVDKWANNIFSTANIGSLTNSGKPAVITIGNCLNGYFINDNVLSMAETFLQPDGKGAAAVWAPTGLGYPAGHRALLEAYYDALFQQDKLEMGAATTAAKIEIYGQSPSWSELVETFVLFGDPAMALGIPTNYPYPESTTPADGATDVAIDQKFRITFNKRMDTASVAVTNSAGLSLTPTWSSSDKVLTLEHDGLTHGETISLSVSGQDLSGNNLQDGVAPKSWSFTVTSDGTPPDADITVGSGGNPAPDSPIIITFSEPVRPSTVEYDLSPSILGYLDWGNSDQVATFIKFDDFEMDTPYTFRITAVTDTAGNERTTPITHAFEISSQPDPTQTPTATNTPDPTSTSEPGPDPSPTPSPTNTPDPDPSPTNTPGPDPSPTPTSDPGTGTGPPDGHDFFVFLPFVTR